jgi:uncharacterized protein (TIGR03437 family)
VSWYAILAVLSSLAGNPARAQSVMPQGVRNILTYSTYLGGSSNDTVHAIAVDTQGSVYLAGETVSPDFPVTPGALQQKHAGVPGNDCSIFTGCYMPDAFVTKLDASGKIVYSTYLGGSGYDVAYAIAVDAQGNAYVAGTTASPNFPVTSGAFQTSALTKSTHAFVSKLNPSGSGLVYSTLVGGSGSETVAGIRVDAAGAAYVAGSTTSADFPVTAGAFQIAAAKSTNPYTPISNGFVLKLNATGSAALYATYLSGSQGSVPQAIALTATGEVFVSGSTASPDFPITKVAYQTTIPPSPSSSSAPSSRFVSRLNAAGSALVYSTFLGGAGNSQYAGIDVDSSGAAYVTGDTLSPFAATPGAFTGPSAPGTVVDTVYVAKLSPNGSQLVYASPLVAGGNAYTLPGAVVVDGQGNAWTTGRTNMPGFPITSNAYQTGYSASACFGSLVGPFAGSGDIFNCGDAYLTEVSSSGATLLYSTYFGSNGGEGGSALAVAPDGSVYVTGTTTSALLPATASAPQTHRTLGPDCTYEGSPSAYGANICSDMFLARFNPSSPAPVLPFEVVNAASYLPGAVAPGEVVALFGPGIGPPESMEYQLDSNGRVATSLEGTQVLFDGTPAPLLYVSANQINAVVPYDTASKRQVEVRIENNPGVCPSPPPPLINCGSTQTIELAYVSPGFPIVAPAVFSADASGSGQAVAFNQDGTLNGPTNLAPAGSAVLVYLNGLGAPVVPVPDGTITGSTLLPVPAGAFDVFVGGKKAQLLYAENAPYSLAGVSQVGFVVPLGLPSGNQPVFVSAGHAESSQSGVWIAVTSSESSSTP